MSDVGPIVPNIRHLQARLLLRSWATKRRCISRLLRRPVTGHASGNRRIHLGNGANSSLERASPHPAVRRFLTVIDAIGPELSVRSTLSARSRVLFALCRRNVEGSTLTKRPLANKLSCMQFEFVDTTADGSASLLRRNTSATIRPRRDSGARERSQRLHRAGGSRSLWVAMSACGWKDLSMKRA